MAFTSILRDITERKQVEDQVRMSAAGLAEAQRLAHLGNWWRDIDTGEAHWSDELCRIHGLTPGQATWDALARMGCDTAQGDYLSRPIPAEEVEQWLRTAP